MPNGVAPVLPGKPARSVGEPPFQIVAWPVPSVMVCRGGPGTLEMPTTWPASLIPVRVAFVAPASGARIVTLYVVALAAAETAKASTQPAIPAFSISRRPQKFSARYPHAAQSICSLSGGLGIPVTGARRFVPLPSANQHSQHRPSTIRIRYIMEYMFGATDQIVTAESCDGGSKSLSPRAPSEPAFPAPRRPTWPPSRRFCFPR